MTDIELARLMRLYHLAWKIHNTDLITDTAYLIGAWGRQGYLSPEDYTHFARMWSEHQHHLRETANPEGA